MVDRVGGTFPWDPVRRKQHLLSMVLVALFVTQLQAQAPRVELHTKDGRVLSGVIDSQTDNSYLCIRTDGNRVAMLRKLPWQDVVKAEVGGRSLTGSELQHRVRELASSQESWPWQPVAAANSHSQSPAAPPPATWIRDVRLSAELASLGSDQDPDTIVLELCPLDREGHPAQMTATVDVVLLAAVNHDFASVPLARGMLWQPVRSWHFQLLAHPSQQGRYVLDLPIEKLAIDRQRLASVYGIIQVRIAIPGQRVLERRLDWVPIEPVRPWQHVWGSAHP